MPVYKLPFLSDDDEHKPKVTMGKARGRATPIFGGPPAIPGTLGWLHYNGKYILNCNVMITTEKEFTKKKLDPIAWYRSLTYQVRE